MCENKASNSEIAHRPESHAATLVDRSAEPATKPDAMIRATGAAGATGAAVTEDADWEATLREMRRFSRSHGVRQMSASQSDAELIAVGLRQNMLMRGAPTTGKRWISRNIAHMLSRLGEDVHLFCRFFSVTSAGQITVDASQLPMGWAQLTRASVLIVDDVPAHPVAAAAFFRHLDGFCKVARCPTLDLPPGKSNEKLPLSTLFSGGGVKPSNKQSAWATTADEAPERLPFGGLQIIATQNVIEPQTVQPHVVWQPRHVSAAATPSHPSHASGPPPTETVRMGLLIANTPQLAEASPHEDIKVVVFHHSQ